MVGSKLGKKAYMVRDQIQQIICSNLTNYLKEDEVTYAVDRNLCKYNFKVKDFVIQIIYDYVDEIYTIRLENWHNNFLNSVTYLSKCRDFKKTVKKIIKNEKLKFSSFRDHVFAITILIKQELDKKNNLIDFDWIYMENLKFDGIFIR